MAVFLTIDGQTLQLDGNKSVAEVDDLFRQRLVEGQDLDRPMPPADEQRGSRLHSSRQRHLVLGRGTKRPDDLRP